MSTWTTLRRLLAPVRPHRMRLVLAAALGAACIGTSVGLMATSAYLVVRAAQRPPILSLTAAIVGVRFFGISRGVLRYLERLVTHDTSFRVLADLRVHLYERIEPLSPGGLETERGGDLLARVVDDVDALQQLYIRGLTPPVVAVATTLLAVAVCWPILPAAAVVVAAAMVVAGVAVPWLAASLARRVGTRAAALRGDLGASVVELIEAAPDLAAFGADARALARVRAADADIAALAVRSSWVGGLTSGLQSLLSGLAMWGTLAVGVVAVRAGAMDGVLLGVLPLTALAAFEAVVPLPAAAQQLRGALASARRLFELADRPVPVADRPAPRTVPADGALVVTGARLRYAAGLPWALDGVDLRLDPGRRVALVGPSGAGKTSVASVLLRFRELDGGAAMLGGVDLRDLPQVDVRRVVGLAGQDAHLFATSVRENLRLARPGATQADLDAAAERARILAWIRALPDGWDTHVGEQGARVSGGERRRLALARALLAGFPILVLDEPTAGLDVATEREVMRDVLDATRGGTVLLITHRLEGLDDVDEVVVLEAGRVVERGAPATLLQRGGVYARMLAAERQVAGGEVAARTAWQPSRRCAVGGGTRGVTHGAVTASRPTRG